MGRDEGSTDSLGKDAYLGLVDGGRLGLDNKRCEKMD